MSLSVLLFSVEKMKQKGEWERSRSTVLAFWECTNHNLSSTNMVCILFWDSMSWYDVESEKFEGSLLCSEKFLPGLISLVVPFLNFCFIVTDHRTSSSFESKLNLLLGVSGEGWNVICLLVPIHQEGVWFMHCLFLIIILLCVFFNVKFFSFMLQLLMDPLILSVLYVWCQINKDTIVQFWFGMQFKVIVVWLCLNPVNECSSQGSHDRPSFQCHSSNR